MKRKGRICLPILCSLALTATASAAALNIERVEVKGAGVTVSGVSEKKDSELTMLVLKKGGSAANEGDILTVGQKKTDGDGKFSIYFEVPAQYNGASSEGEYEIILNLSKANEEKASAELVYISEQTRGELLELIKTGTAAEIAAGISQNDLYQKGFGSEGADIEKFLRLSDKMKESLFAELLEGRDKDALTLDGMMTEFNLLAVFYEFNSSESIAENLKILNPEFAEKKYNDLSESEHEFLTEAVKKVLPCASYKEFLTKYPTCAILSTLNTARYSDIDSLMSDYSTELGLGANASYTKYSKMNEKNKQTVCEEIVKNLDKSKAYTVDDYQAALKTAVDGIGSSSGGSGGGGGSSSGSSSGKNSSASKNTYVTAPVSNGVTAVEADVKELQDKFDDLDGAEWAKEAISELAKKGIVSGRGEKKFDPNGIVTREEFVKMIVDAAGVHEKDAVCSFEDVVSGSWYESYVASAVKNGLVSGRDETSFGVGEPITRQDVCVIAAKLLKNAENEDSSFTDWDEVADYAKESVARLAGAKIISGMGDGSFGPGRTCTRAQAAKIIYGILKGE